MKTTKPYVTEMESFQKNNYQMCIKRLLFLQNFFEWRFS